MSKNIITKSALADALKALMRERGLSRISVKDITDYCGVSRNTFYYHFDDKYSLLNWIFYAETLTEINTFNEPGRWLEGFVNLCKYLRENRDFYLEAFRYVGQNSLKDYLFNFYYELLVLHISSEYRQIGIILDKDDAAMCAKMEAHSYVGVIMDWVEEGMQDNYMRYYEQLKKINKLERYRFSMFSGFSMFSEDIMTNEGG